MGGRRGAVRLLTVTSLPLSPNTHARTHAHAHTGRERARENQRKRERKRERSTGISSVYCTEKSAQWLTKLHPKASVLATVKPYQWLVYNPLPLQTYQAQPMANGCVSTCQGNCLSTHVFPNRYLSATDSDHKWLTVKLS